MFKTTVTSNTADGNPHSMLDYLDSKVNMDIVSISDNTELGLNRGNLEFVRSNVSITNSNVTNNLADLGPNLYLVNSTCLFNKLSFLYHEAFNLNDFSRTILITNTKIMMYDTLFYGNENSFIISSIFLDGYFIESNDNLSQINCDKKSLLCYDPDGDLLYGVDTESNCTFSDQCEEL